MASSSMSLGSDMAPVVPAHMCIHTHTLTHTRARAHAASHTSEEERLLGMEREEVRERWMEREGGERWWRERWRGMGGGRAGEGRMERHGLRGDEETGVEGGGRTELDRRM